MALWDIFGKACDKPVYQLLGGHKEKALVYATMSNFSPKRAAKEAREHQKEGFVGCKLKLGVGENYDTWSTDIERDIEIVSMTRKAVGDDFPLMIDSNAAYGLCGGIKLAKALEKYEPKWFEEPMPTRYLDDYRVLKSKIDIPIAAGESEPLLSQQKDLIVRGNIDILQPDVAANTRGLTDGKKVAALAKAFGRVCQPHTWGGIGINLAANLALCCSIDNGDFCEYDVSENPLRQCLKEPLKPGRDGFIGIPKKPGLGVELNEEMIKKYRI